MPTSTEVRRHLNYFDVKLIPVENFTTIAPLYVIMQPCLVIIDVSVLNQSNRLSIFVSEGTSNIDKYLLLDVDDHLIVFLCLCDNYALIMTEKFQSF